MNEPKVTVVIPTYNRSDLLPRAIKSIQNQTYQNYELLVVDDASTDNTDELMEQFISDKIKYIKLDENVGQCIARNKASEKATGEYIGFLDSDDEWLPEKIEKQIKLFQNSPVENVGAVYCGFIEKDEVLNKTEVINRDNLRGHIYDRFLSGFCPSTTSMFLVKTEAFRKVNGFDEYLITFVDYDLWLRISKAGYGFDYVDEPLIVKYEHQGDQMAKNLDKRLKGLSQFLGKWGDEIKRVAGKGTYQKFKRAKVEVVVKSMLEKASGDYRKDIIRAVGLLREVNSKRVKLYLKALLIFIFGRISRQSA